MTDEPQNLPARITEEYGTGLEDADPNQISVPRLKIDHPNGVFKDGLTGDEFAKLDGVFLGMIRQRVFFTSTMEERDVKPRCKSNDAEHGFPNMEGPDPDDKYPWHETKLDPNLMPRDEHKRVMVPCKACPFSQWTGTRAKPIPPKCGELHSYPVMYSSTEGGPIDRAGIVQFKGSGVKPSNTFLKGFMMSKRPVYSSTSAVELEVKKRGMVMYSVPKFTRGEPIPEDEWEEYAQELHGLRELLRQPPRPADDEEAPPAGAAMNIPAPPPAAQPAAPHIPAQRTAPPAAPAAPATPASVIDAASGNVPQSAPVEVDEDDLPF